MDVDWVVMLACITMSILLLGFEANAAPTYDEVKQERLAKARAERRAIEAKYETCLHECRIKCGGWK